MGVQAMGQQTEPATADMLRLDAGEKRTIVVSLEDRKLALVEDGQVKKVYTVAVGKPTTPSPIGTFTIAAARQEPDVLSTMARPFCRDRGIRWGRGGWD